MRIPDIIIAVDGYSSTGKSSFAKIIANEFSFLYLDSGALYRGVTLFAIENGYIDADGSIDVPGLDKALDGLDLHFGEKGTYIGDRCIEREIRSLAVADKVSPIATVPQVREFVDKKLREFGKLKRVVMDGRDIGTTVFPDAELKILDYNRVVHDLNGMSKEEFLEKLEKVYEIQKADGPCRPQEKHAMGMYMDGQWYLCRAREGSYPAEDPVGQLDVSILQNQVLTPLLDIDDPRTSSRIDFVGGIRGLGELKKMVDGGMAVAFAMYPTGLDDLMNIADNDCIMPPKSTWFEPKLRSGIFVHRLK